MSQPLIIGVHFRSPKCTILCASVPSFFSWLDAAIAKAATPSNTTSTLPIGIFFINVPPLKNWAPFGQNDTPGGCRPQDLRRGSHLYSNDVRCCRGWREE